MARRKLWSWLSHCLRWRGRHFGGGETQREHHVTCCEVLFVWSEIHTEQCRWLCGNWGRLESKGRRGRASQRAAFLPRLDTPASWIGPYAFHIKAKVCFWKAPGPSRHFEASKTVKENKHENHTLCGIKFGILLDGGFRWVYIESMRNRCPNCFQPSACEKNNKYPCPRKHTLDKQWALLTGCGGYLWYS